MQTPDASADLIRRQFAQRDTYGVVNVAHGDTGLGGDIEGVDYSVTPGEVTPDHNLGAIKIVQCYGETKASERRKHLSPSGYFWGGHGLIIPLAYTNPHGIE